MGKRHLVHGNPGEERRDDDPYRVTSETRTLTAYANSNRGNNLLKSPERTASPGKNARYLYEFFMKFIVFIYAVNSCASSGKGW
jgi:hypothetical protein